MLRLKFSNLIANHDGRGLVGKLDGINYEPDFEPGVFEKNGRILPKVNKFDCSFTVLHTVALGFNQQGAYRDPNGSRFPYYTSVGNEANPGQDPSNQETEGADETTAPQGTPAAETADGEQSIAEEEVRPDDGPAAAEVDQAQDAAIEAMTVTGPNAGFGPAAFEDIVFVDRATGQESRAVLDDDGGIRGFRQQGEGSSE